MSTQISNKTNLTIFLSLMHNFHRNSLTCSMLDSIFNYPKNLPVIVAMSGMLHFMESTGLN